MTATKTLTAAEEKILDEAEVELQEVLGRLRQLEKRIKRIKANQERRRAKKAGAS